MDQAYGLLQHRILERHEEIALAQVVERGRLADRALQDHPDLDTAIQADLRRLSRLGKDTGAIAAYRSAMQAYEAMQATLSEDVQSGSDIYNAACVCSLASQPLDGETGQLEEQAIRAVKLLKRARDAGWDNLPHIMNDADFNPIRDRQDFKEFVGTLKVAP